MMGMIKLGTLALAITAAAGAADFNWAGSIPAGKSIQVRNVNGRIAAEAAVSGQVEVSAVKVVRRGDPNSVDVRYNQNGDGVVVCAVYRDSSGQFPADCNSHNSSNNNNKNNENDVRIDFTVKVPAGVVLDAASVNGSVEGQNLRSDVHARTVNGNVDVSSSETVQASTVNGSIKAQMGRLAAGRGADFQTVNGSVKVSMPDGVNAHLSVHTVNGSLHSDFPVTIQGRFGPKSMEGNLGSGGPELKIHTVNGSVELTRR